MSAFLEKNYKLINKTSLAFIGIFVFFHIFNHLLALVSIEYHINFMENFRIIYRNTFVEIILLVFILFQIIQTIKDIWKKRKVKKTLFEKFTLGIKLYFIYFLINHISAVLVGRWLLDLDTNIYYAIAGLHISPFSFYFIPYYFLSIVCLFFFISKDKSTYAFYGINIIGFTIALFLLLSFKGVFYPIEIPIKYFNIYMY